MDALAGGCDGAGVTPDVGEGGMDAVGTAVASGEGVETGGAVDLAPLSQAVRMRAAATQATNVRVADRCRDIWPSSLCRGSSIESRAGGAITPVVVAIGAFEITAMKLRDRPPWSRS